MTEKEIASWVLLVSLAVGTVGFLIALLKSYIDYKNGKIPEDF